MADPRFKVKRQAYFKRGIIASSALTLGSGGTQLTGILCGSGDITYGAVSASVASATCLTVTGITPSHKVFINAACISACMTPACAYCLTDDELITVFLNQSSEALGAGTSTLHYFAILDK